MRHLFYSIVFWLLVSSLGYSQEQFIVKNKKGTDKIEFKLINNLIVIPLEINGVTLSFLVDTGVSKPIVFNFLNISDSLKIKNPQSILLRGLGEGEPINAFRSRNNVFRIGAVVNNNQDLYAIHDSDINFSSKLGMPIHGIIGFDLFKDLVVEINYKRQFLKLTNPGKEVNKPCRTCEEFVLEFYNNKPYIMGEVEIDKKRIPVKMLMDSGGSDALWLFENKKEGIVVSDYYFNDFLGHGLSGSVYGKRSKIKAFYLKNFAIKNPNVAFPDSTSIGHVLSHKERHGSIAAGVLKRFNLIFNYRKATVILKKNSFFKAPFGYNKSGIELAHDGVQFVKEAGYFVSHTAPKVNQKLENSTQTEFNSSYKLTLKPVYSIVELRANSPADKAGLQIGDRILSINNKRAYRFTLQKLTEFFYGDHGTRIKLKIERDGSIFVCNFNLEDVLNNKKGLKP
ncbi:PDZ domain-containing protein [Algibacter pacificus]|uniref:PDZ domain-containing protein n=1 Tax=Algibacter pacificus TaxID=2599389 RepID=UPI0011CA827F|nr:PDZ domain-containing protein [Algibacter pacificus]